MRTFSPPGKVFPSSTQTVSQSLPRLGPSDPPGPRCAGCAGAEARSGQRRMKSALPRSILVLLRVRETCSQPRVGIELQHEAVIHVQLLTQILEHLWLNGKRLQRGAQRSPIVAPSAILHVLGWKGC